MPILDSLIKNSLTALKKKPTAQTNVQQVGRDSSVPLGDHNCLITLPKQWLRVNTLG